MRSLFLIAKSSFFLALSLTGPAPGMRFDRYGRRLGVRNRLAKKPASALLLNPVSSVRYFEFDFVERQLRGASPSRVLDVSSPALFGHYFSEKNDCDYLYTNMDGREFDGIAKCIPQVRVRGSYSTEQMDATAMPFEDGSFDAVISISVVEHIPEVGDSRAIEEMWRVLRPGGRLVITIPACRTYREEFRSSDVYEVGVKADGGQFFFQRLYDEAAVRTRIVERLEDSLLVAKDLYGEREAGFFAAYEARWIARGLAETVKDPYLMARHMTRFGTIEELPGVGVLGLCLQKASAQTAGR